MALQNPLIPAPINQPSDNPPAPATGLTTDDLARLRHSLDSSVSDNTRKMYASAWRSFQVWTLGRGNLSLPASPQLVAAYLAHLAEERNLSVATIRLHKAALAAVHKTMKGIGRTHGRTQRQAKPLTAEALAAPSGPPPTPARHPWETARSWNPPTEPPGAAGWTWPSSPLYGTACSDAQRPIPSHGQM